MVGSLVNEGFIALATIAEEGSDLEADTPFKEVTGLVVPEAPNEGRQACTRSLTEAGLPATPGSARARKKRGGRRA